MTKYVVYLCPSMITVPKKTQMDQLLHVAMVTQPDSQPIVSVVMVSV